MATRQDREKATKQNERHQAILAEMLNDDANKYCADCRSKGPRWASWNLGVFVCIRCAGIHRNLGVHISKMKSVNLDTWTPEQIECVRAKGNGIVNASYEHGLPEGFRRPTDDSAVEAFIRSKYERKQYYKKSDRAEKVATSTSSTSSKGEKMPKREAKKKTSQTAKVSKTTVSAVPRPTSNTAIRSSPAAQRAAPKPAASPAPDLLSGLDAPSPVAQATSSAQSVSSDSGMGAFMGAASSPNPNVDMFGAAPAAAQNHQTDLFQSAPAPAPVAQAGPQPANKASILSLYGAQQQQQAAVGNFAAPGGVAGSNGMSAGQMAYQQQVMMQQQMQQQMYMQQQLAMQQQQLAMQHQALQVNQVQEQMARLRMAPGGAPQNGQMGGWGQQPQQPQQQPGQTMNNNLWN